MRLVFTLSLSAVLLAGAAFSAPGAQAMAGKAVLAQQLGLPESLLDKALRARERFAREVRNGRYLVIIDYAAPSDKKRLYVLDLDNGAGEAYLVAHGQGSDPDHDGVADQFSNAVGSRMSSLGAFVTGQTYRGQHGLSLRLRGLEASNDRAEERAIVIHGADYVSPGRHVLGRSWGCPALEPEVARRLIPRLAGGAFVYASR